MIYHPPDYIDRRIEELKAALIEQKEAYNWYTTVSIEMRIKDEKLMRKALEALQYAYENLPLIHATEIDPTIVKLEDRLDEGR